LDLPKQRADTHPKKLTPQDSSMIFLDNSDFFSHNSKRDGVPYEHSHKPSSIPDDGYKPSSYAESDTSSEEEFKEA